MPGGKCVFNKLWLEKDEYKDWLLLESRHKAKCSLCDKVFDISNMGEPAIKHHMKGAKHNNFLLAKTKSSCTIKNFFASVGPSTSADQSTSAGPTNLQKKMDCFGIGKSVLDAEILWVLKCIKSHYSYKSSEDSGKLFKQMFPDSQIAKQFSCGERKCAYICNFGLAPYFQATLFKYLKEVKNFTLLFDETLNRTNQQKQLDIHVRFWNTEKNVIQTTYLTSAFIGHSTAEDLLSAFYRCTEKLDLSKVLQISMDGPAVNWKFYDLLQHDLLKEHNVQCVAIGSCGLHIINNAFKKGVEKTDWNLSSILTSLYWLFHDSPARREDFLEVAREKKFPIKFCNCRWLENVPAAERAIQIWDDIKKYVKNVENGKFSKVTCKSFVAVSEAAKDNYMKIKLNVFLSVAKILHPFLEVYQSENPLLPFLVEDVFKLIKQCLEQFCVLKAEILASMSTVENILKFDFLDIKYLETKEKVSLGFIGDKIIKEKFSKKEINPGDVLHLKYNCQKLILNMIHNLLLKCPINYPLVRGICCIDPRMMVNDALKSKYKMKQVLLHLVKKNQVSEKDGDDILSEYSTFLEDVVKKSKLEFKNFDLRTESLDKFFYQFFKSGEFPKLWEIVKMLMILSHGQASVERGFSINKAVEVENLKEDSFISQRIIYDNVKFAGSIFDIQITNEMRISVSSARSKYMQYLEEQKKQKETDNRKRKRTLLQEEIDFLEQKKTYIEKDIVDYEKEADSLSEKAESNRDIHLFMKSNELRKYIKEKKSNIAEIIIEINEKKNEMKGGI